MPNAVHAKDAILDAARALVLERGVQHATVSAISEESGAPVGSLYHHFGSRDDLVAELWVRAVRRSQVPFLAAARHPNAEAAAVGEVAVRAQAEGQRAEALTPALTAASTANKRTRSNQAKRRQFRIKKTLRRPEAQPPLRTTLTALSVDRVSASGIHPMECQSAHRIRLGLP